ncbi:alpha/beta fold hydrolase [Bacillus sp. C1]
MYKKFINSPIPIIGLCPAGYYYFSYFEGWWPWSNGVLESDKSPPPLPAQQQLTFVLVHGSWADAHFWDGVAAVLRRRGHAVYMPEYAGHGKDPNKNVTHAMVTKSVGDGDHFTDTRTRPAGMTCCKSKSDQRFANIWRLFEKERRGTLQRSSFAGYLFKY